jgi:hypothetical protein
MASNRLPDNQEDREVYLRDHAKGFIEAVSNARRESMDTVVMTVKAFAGEPEVLFVALDYAYDSGVAVTMAPPAGPMRSTPDPRRATSSSCAALAELFVGPASPRVP